MKKIHVKPSQNNYRQRTRLGEELVFEKRQPGTVA